MNAPLSLIAQREYVLTDDDLIITKTDPKGVITYANRDFMRICGYREDALLGHPHSIIRHPDMPRGAFRLLWKTLQRGEEFFGVVKNRIADNGFYWVLANITPDFDRHGALKGYYSVRRRPARAALDALIPVYEQMNTIERNSGKKDAPDLSLAWLERHIAELGFASYEQLVLSLNQEVFSRRQHA